MLRIFGHYIPTSIVLLMIIELIVLFMSVYAGAYARFFDSSNITSELSLLQPINIKAGVFAAIMWLSMVATGLHARNNVDDFSAIMIRIFISFILGLALIIATYYIYPKVFLGRGVFAFSLIIAFIGILFTRTLFYKIDNHNAFKRRLLILGTGNKGKMLEGYKDYAMKRGYDIAGFINVDQNEVLINPDNILTIESTLLDLCIDNDISEIVLAMDDRRVGFPLSGLLECKMKGIVVREILDSLERITGHIELDALHPSSVIFSDGFTNAVSISYIKRIFDVFASLLILLLASPIIIITACAIWLSSFGRDPIFYRQIRLGLCDAPFGVLKFRSMKTDAEKDGAQFASKNDSRVTIIGAFIRKTRIDELPQLFNVLKGDMSFIGPRPERPQFVLGFEQSIPHYSLRHTVKPGITGWAQICYPYGDTEEDTKNKLQYDLYYIKNYSLFLDMNILFQTVQVVLFGQGAR
ncbi:MAG: sugar transferase [endosymbiont of Galathealinum brachiosum]|uniref:Sugar transferase n=1 Tax=endosymbiont of Galathealinum brachiosum TaxID=2200906 RepID=A0A370DHB6_9GAMM|nr:MAG: sugar transferase [endosymbiont of Galathealinum brachiosum]